MKVKIFIKKEVLDGKEVLMEQKFLWKKKFLWNKSSYGTKVFMEKEIIMCRKTKMYRKVKITKIVKRLCGILFVAAWIVCGSDLQAICANADVKDIRELYPAVHTVLPVETSESEIGSASLMQDELNQTKINIDISGIRQKLFGRMMDFFATAIDLQHPEYGTLCKEQSHPYYVLEFNDASKYDCAIYDAADDSLTFYKKSGNRYEMVERGNTEEQTTIADQAMQANKKVTEVTIGNHVTLIGEKAFAGCTALNKVKVGTGLKTIGKAAFSGDKNLTLFVIKSKNLTKVGKNALSNTKSAIKMKVLGEKISKYKKLFRGKGQDIPLIFRNY